MQRCHGWYGQSLGDTTIWRWPIFGVVVVPSPSPRLFLEDMTHSDVIAWFNSSCAHGNCHSSLVRLLSSNRSAFAAASSSLQLNHPPSLPNSCHILEEGDDEEAFLFTVDRDSQISVKRFKCKFYTNLIMGLLHYRIGWRPNSILFLRQLTTHSHLTSSINQFPPKREKDK